MEKIDIDCKGILQDSVIKYPTGKLEFVLLSRSVIHRARAWYFSQLG